jgi:signal transduction histidine kinase
MLELARKDETVSEDTASYVADAGSAAERLIKLVNDLLDVSRLERGTLSVNPQPVDLAGLTRSVLDELASLVQEQGHRISLALDDGPPAALGDAQLLRQVVLNLVSNAIKYTPPGGEISVEVRAEGPSVRWSIRDSGIGIPDEARARLFEKFYRADNVAQIETEGTGLGLYIVRLIVEHLGGRVWCESGEGHGAAFFVTLPRPDRAEADAAPVREG